MIWKRTTLNLGRHYASDDLSVNFTPSVIDRILEVVAIVFGLAAFAMAFYWIIKEPEKPLLIWLIPILIPFAIYQLYRQGYAKIQRIGFPVRITKQNLGIQYLLAVRLARVLNIFVGGSFLCATLNLVYNMMYLPIISIGLVVLMLLSFIVYYFFAFRYR